MFKKGKSLWNIEDLLKDSKSNVFNTLHFKNCSNIGGRKRKTSKLFDDILIWIAKIYPFHSSNVLKHYLKIPIRCSAVRYSLYNA